MGNGTSPIASVENHREREKGVLVYPVYSRRSDGLSVGINLFPDQKCCSFDCPYCEVFPFKTDAKIAGNQFSVDQMEHDLRAAIADAAARNIAVKDICFSGNGEPTMSPAFPHALKRAACVRDETAAGAELVLITNGTGLLRKDVFSLLREAVISTNIDIWLKLDAGTQDWYEKMNRSDVPFEKLVNKIKEFTAVSRVTIQTMICAVDGKGPPPEEEQAWIQLMTALAAIASNGAGIRKVQIYGKVRPSPEDPKTTALPPEYLEKRAESLHRALVNIFPSPPVEVYL